MIPIHKVLIIAQIRNLFSQGIQYYIQDIPKQLLAFFSFLFPFLLSIAIVTVNLSLISGSIIYLLNYNEENGKMMIFRSISILILLIFIFNLEFPNSPFVEEPFEGFYILMSFITSYLLFIFAVLSLIIFLGNLGLYLIISDSKRIKNLKKSGFCLVCIILPLNFQFPKMPLWKM
ncbi:MAG: hypothetical protein ACFFB2_10795 [Promethearchaeota archaeon]